MLNNKNVTLVSLLTHIDAKEDEHIPRKVKPISTPQISYYPSVSLFPLACSSTTISLSLSLFLFPLTYSLFLISSLSDGCVEEIDLPPQQKPRSTNNNEGCTFSL